VEQWFSENAKDALGVLITDNFDEGKKRSLKRVFRESRKSLPDKSELSLDHLIDDMYFGDSADSIGIQLARMSHRGGGERQK
jgi:hypothetical protein